MPARACAALRPVPGRRCSASPPRPSGRRRCAGRSPSKLWSTMRTPTALEKALRRPRTSGAPARRHAVVACSAAAATAIRASGRSWAPSPAGLAGRVAPPPATTRVSRRLEADPRSRSSLARLATTRSPVHRGPRPRRSAMPSARPGPRDVVLHRRQGPRGLPGTRRWAQDAVLRCSDGGGGGLAGTNAARRHRRCDRRRSKRRPAAETSAVALTAASLRPGQPAPVASTTADGYGYGGRAGCAGGRSQAGRSSPAPPMATLAIWPRCCPARAPPSAPRAHRPGRPASPQRHA